jgi:protoheme IX farnesyltransferase
MNLLVLLRLGKAPVSFLAACSAATGFILAASKERAPVGVWAPFLGTFFLALGASAVNQLQDRAVDGRMERTRGRPLPSGAIGVPAASGAAALFLLAGLLLLARSGAAPAGLGGLAVAWYNGVYAWLKRRSAFAAVPGSLVGSIPPAIGWAAAGGRLTDPALLALGAFFALWQLPHFWLLLLDRREDYERAALPVPTRLLGFGQARQDRWQAVVYQQPAVSV